ncbi:MAG: 50S ribosomal protein L17 [Niabella sp.]
MRHGDKIKNLSRKKAHRDALLSNLSCQLIEHKRIVTTLAKAKALRVYVEPLITKSKDNTTHQRRIVFGYLQDKSAVTELFNNISAKVAGRPGGYTRIIKLGIRPGDAAEKAMIELVDYNEIYGKGLGEEKAAGKRTRRRGGSGKKKAETTETPVEAATATTDEVKSDVKEAPAADDIAKIEGIGPKAAEALTAAGLGTFAALAAKTPEEIKAVLEAADGNFNALVPDTWPQQAALAADGKWDELTGLQEELKGGKEA